MFSEMGHTRRIIQLDIFPWIILDSEAFMALLSTHVRYKSVEVLALVSDIIYLMQLGMPFSEHDIPLSLEFKVSLWSPWQQTDSIIGLQLLLLFFFFSLTQ